MQHNLKHLEHIRDVVEEDLRYIDKKDRSYNGSWKMSGGRSAWFMLKRKIDRLVEFLKLPEPPESNVNGNLLAAIESASGVGDDVTLDRSVAEYLRKMMLAEDIFQLIEADPSGEDGTVLAEVRDLRRYLTLVEAEMVARGVVELPRSITDLLKVSPAMGIPMEEANHLLATVGAGIEFYNSPDVGVQLRRTKITTGTRSVHEVMQATGVPMKTDFGGGQHGELKASLFRNGKRVPDEKVPEVIQKEWPRNTRTMGKDGHDIVVPVVVSEVDGHRDYPGTPEDGGHHEPRERWLLPENLQLELEVWRRSKSNWKRVVIKNTMGRIFSAELLRDGTQLKEVGKDADEGVVIPLNLIPSVVAGWRPYVCPECKKHTTEPCPLVGNSEALGCELYRDHKSEWLQSDRDAGVAL